MIRDTLRCSTSSNAVRLLRVSLAGIALLALAQLSAAQPYPSKLIRLVTGSSAGGAADVTARQIAPRLSEALKQQIIVDNRPGVAGMVANEYVEQGGGGRLHDSLPAGVLHDRDGHPERKGSVGSDEKPRAGYPGRPLRLRRCRASLRACENGQGIDCRRSRPAQGHHVRLDGRRQQFPSRRGAVRPPRESGTVARAVQGKSPGHRGPPVGTRRHHVHPGAAVAGAPANDWLRKLAT